MASYTYEFIELGDESSLGCKCCRFGHGVDLPVPKQLSDAEIAKLAYGFSHKIFKDWSILHAIMKRFQGTIQKRWMKKTPAQRREMLLKAWPEMPVDHRPDFAGFRKTQNSLKAPRSRTLFSAAYLWPQINVEDLLQRELLIIFLDARSRNLPDVFAYADLDAAHLGHAWDAYEDRPDGITVVMDLSNKHSPRTYGAMKKLDSKKLEFLMSRVVSRAELVSPTESKPSKRMGMKYHPMLGLLALEIQERIYAFLHECAKLILHDIHPSQFFLATKQPRPVLPNPTSKEWPSLRSHMLEATYRVPQKMDLDRLKALVSGRRASAEDHLWMLQDDPAYFIETLREEKEHDCVSAYHTCSECWWDVVYHVVTDAFMYLLCWDHVHKLLEAMPPMDVQLQHADLRTLRLRKKDEYAWEQLLEAAEDMINQPLARLNKGVPPSPRLRHIYPYTKTVTKGDKPDRQIWQACSTRHLKESEYRIHLLFSSLTNTDLRELHGSNRLVQEIQHMLDADDKASHLVDSWVVGHFSDVAMFSELSTRIHGLSPWSLTWRAKSIRQSNAAKATMTKLADSADDISKAIWNACRNAKFDIDPYHPCWEYPTHKNMTEENVNKMRTAEVHLDVVWEYLHEECHRARLCISKIMEKRFLEKREHHRTPEWVPPLVAQKAKVLAEGHQNVPRLQRTVWTDQPDTPNKPKEKVKTRGIASPHIDQSEKSTFPSKEPATTATEKITVPKRAYKILAALLPESTAENHQRTEIAWDDFLQALNAIGLQPEKLYGSVWMFRPKFDALVDMKRSIQFHEPKEVRKGNKIPASMVRVLGRRLKHAYGWEGGMFVPG